VNRWQTYFLIILILAGVAIAGTIYVRRLAKPSHDVIKTEVCPRCGGTGRAKLRPEYPCATCDGTGYITP
jgi:DnaJ-class molecular chaperone